MASETTLIVAGGRDASRWEKPGKKLYTYDVYLGRTLIGQVRSAVIMHSKMSDNRRIRLHDYYSVVWQFKTTKPGDQWPIGYGYGTRHEAVTLLTQCAEASMSEATCRTCPHVIVGALWSVCQNEVSHLYMRQVDPGADSCGLHPDRKEAEHE